MLTDTANFRNPNYHAASDALATLDLGFATDVTRAVEGQAATQAALLPEPGDLPGLLAGLGPISGLRRTRTRP